MAGRHAFLPLLVLPACSSSSTDQSSLLQVMVRGDWLDQHADHYSHDQRLGELMSAAWPVAKKRIAEDNAHDNKESLSAARSQRIPFDQVKPISIELAENEAVRRTNKVHGAVAHEEIPFEISTFGLNTPAGGHAAIVAQGSGAEAVPVNSRMAAAGANMELPSNEAIPVAEQFAAEMKQGIESRFHTAVVDDVGVREELPGTVVGDVSVNEESPPSPQVPGTPDAVASDEYSLTSGGQLTPADEETDLVANEAVPVTAAVGDAGVNTESAVAAQAQPATSTEEGAPASSRFSLPWARKPEGAVVDPKTIGSSHSEQDIDAQQALAAAAQAAASNIKLGALECVFLILLFVGSMSEKKTVDG